MWIYGATIRSLEQFSIFINKKNQQHFSKNLRMNKENSNGNMDQCSGANDAIFNKQQFVKRIFSSLSFPQLCIDSTYSLYLRKKKGKRKKLRKKQQMSFQFGDKRFTHATFVCI